MSNGKKEWAIPEEAPPVKRRLGKIMWREKNILATIVLCVVVIGGMLAAYFGCENGVRARGLDQFEDAANNVIDQIDSKFERDGEILTSMAHILAESPAFDESDPATFKEELVKSLRVVDPLRQTMNLRVLVPSERGGTIFLPEEDRTVNANQFTYDEEVKHGPHISARFESSRDGYEGQQLIAYFVPIERAAAGGGTETVALLYGVTPLSSLPSLLRTDNIYNGNASILIFDVKNEGHATIMDTWHGKKEDGSYDPAYRLGSFDDFGLRESNGKSAAETGQDLLGLREGYTEFYSRSENQWLAFYYAPAGGVVSDQWEICVTVPTEVAFGSVNDVRIVFVIVGVIFFCTLVAYFVFVRFSAREAIKKSVERAVLEEKLHKAEAAERAKTTFLSNMSHDIRTPMNAILGFAMLAETNIDNRERVQDYLKKILSSGNHLLSLINDILDMSRIESGKLNIEEKPCSLADIFHDMRNIIQSQMKSKQLNFFMDTLDVVDEDIFCDKLHINQILLNLLSNAIKFTPPGGSVSLTVSQKAGAPTGYGSYEIRVKDTGIGMSKEFAKHIFEPFERERTSTVSGIQGTGLGMAITKNIVDTMGGTIRLETEQGKGSEFIIDLQFRLQEAHRHTELIHELEGLRALVVDDNFDTCDSVSKMLHQIGMRSEWTMYGKEAVLRAQQAVEVGDSFAVYIIDWVMPDLSGIEIVRRIRKVVGDDVPIIVITAYDVTAIMEEAKDVGVTAYCNKPVFLSELRDTLASAVGAAESREEKPDGLVSDADYEAFKGKRVLLVEDNELNREIAEELLIENGFVVETADNGKTALDCVSAAAAGYFDLVLMDVLMPVMDGYEATRAIRALPDAGVASVPIVAMTANAFDEDRRLAAESGMNAHVAKPINVPQLMEVLKSVLGGEKGAHEAHEKPVEKPEA